jgi:branched-chain amino acid transport system substrate-binding protein
LTSLGLSEPGDSLTSTRGPSRRAFLKSALAVGIGSGLLAIGCSAPSASTPSTGASGAASQPTTAPANSSATGSTAAKLLDPIPVGIVDIFTGQAAAYGESARQGHDVALDEINAGSGVAGSKLKFIYEDEAGKPEQAVQAYQKVINQDKVVAILGPGYTPSALAVQKIGEDAKIPSIAPIPSAQPVTEGGYKYFFRTSPDDLNMTQQLVKYVFEKTGQKEFGILAYNNDLGKSGVDTVTKYVNLAGGKILDVELVNLGDKDMSGQLAKFKSSGVVHAFVWTQHTEAALLARQAQEKGQELRMYGGTTLTSPKLMELGGDAVNGTIFVNTFDADSASGRAKQFVDAYKKKYDNKVPDNFAAQAYDAVYLLKDAIERAKSVDGTAIRDALAATTDFSGAMGEHMKVLPNGDLDINFIFMQVSEGKWKRIG